MKRGCLDNSRDFEYRSRVEDWNAVLSQDTVEEEVWDLFYINFEDVKLKPSTRRNIFRLIWIKDEFDLLRRMKPVGDETEIVCLQPFPSRILTAVTKGDEYPDCPYDIDVITSKVIDTGDIRKLGMFMKLCDKALIAVWAKCCRHPTINKKMMTKLAADSPTSRFFCYRSKANDRSDNQSAPHHFQTLQRFQSPQAFLLEQFHEFP